jgi:hypothetical protein
MDIPLPLIKGIWGDLKEIGDFTLRQQMQALGLTPLKINDLVWERHPISLTTPAHHFKSGDAVCVKKWNAQPLKLHWRGSFVILSTFTTVKVAEIAPWIHHSRVKPASLKWECIPDLASPCKITLWNAHTLPQQDPAS